MSNNQEPLSIRPHNDDVAVSKRLRNIRSYAVIKGMMGSQMIDALPLRLRCECSIIACKQVIELTLSERRELRQRYPQGFIIEQDHAVPSDEILGDQHPHYIVVSKPAIKTSIEEVYDSIDV